MLLKRFTVRLLVGLMLFTLFSSSLTLDVSASGPDGSAEWTYCADENSVCSFSGTMEVRYWGYDSNTSATVGFINKIATNNIFCASTYFGGDPAYGVAKKCYYRSLQLDSGAIATTVSGLNNNVSVTFNVYAKQAGTTADLKNKITIKKTSGGNFEALGTNDTVMNSTSTPSASKLEINLNETLVGSENVIKIDGGAFVDSAGTPYLQPIVIKDIRFTPPTLTADTTENYTVKDIELTFADDTLWRNAITAVSVDGDPLVEGTEYRVDPGIITILSGVLTKGIHDIVVEASGYSEVLVSQEIIKLYTGAGSGTIIDPYLIATAADLNDVRDHLESTFRLTANIDLSGYPNWEPIGHYYNDPFLGKLDGNGYKITNLRLDRRSGSFNGLFALIGSSGKVENLCMENVNIIGGENTGALAGYNYGTIRNSYAKGTVGGSYSVGGLMGNNSGNTSNNYFSGAVSGFISIGGLIGQNTFGSLSNSYSTGTVSGYNQVAGLVGSSLYVTNNNSYSSGKVNGADNSGGLAGYSNGSSFVSSYYDSETSQQSDTGKGDGKTTADMKNKATFVGWDFISEWYMLPGQYPRLWTFTGLHKGTNFGTTKLIHVADGMEYSVNDGSYLPITSSEVDNISVIAGDTISVRVTATATEPASDPRTLTVSSDRISSLSTNASLSTLTLSGVTLNPAFNGTILVYTANVANNVTHTIVAATTSDPQAVITGSDLGSKPLAVGDNKITVHVTAQDGTTTDIYNVTVTRAAATIQPINTGGGGGGGSSSASSTDGRLTLQSGKAGDVSLGNEISLSIPANATLKELKVTIEKVTDPQKLLTKDDVLISTIYELLKNFTDNFTKPVMLTLTFDPSQLKKNQTAVVVYYDEGKKSWVEVPGGIISGNQITVMVNHFTKFAVFAVNQSKEVPTPDKKPTVILNDITGHWAEATIKQAQDSGIVNGYSDGSFKPNNAMTRAEFTVMLMKTLKVQVSGKALSFSDADKIGAWARGAVAQAVQAGYIKGYDDGTFRPDAELTRAEMAMMVAKASGLDLLTNTSTDFNDDKDIPKWAKGAVAAIKKMGYIEGKGSNQFDPKAKTTRAEALTVLLKMIAQKDK